MSIYNNFQSESVNRSKIWLSLRALEEDLDVLAQIQGAERRVVGIFVPDGKDWDYVIGRVRVAVLVVVCCLSTTMDISGIRIRILILMKLGPSCF